LASEQHKFSIDFHDKWGIVLVTPQNFHRGSTDEHQSYQRSLPLFDLRKQQIVEPTKGLEPIRDPWEFHTS